MKIKSRIGIFLTGTLVILLCIGVSELSLPKAFTGQTTAVNEKYFTEQSVDELMVEGNFAEALLSIEYQREQVRQRMAEAVLEEADNTEPLREEGRDIYYEKEGKEYSKVPDLIDGGYYWASVVTRGNMVKDEHGCEHVDYNSQSRIFERLRDGKIIEVRRWDNLYYSAGDYLIFEYDGTMHISDYQDLYHPILSYDVAGTYGIITKVLGGYMVADDREYTVTFYNQGFQMAKQIKGYRAECSEEYYKNGLMAVRDMETGRMGFMDQTGRLQIPCEYGLVSEFSNGYASVLIGAELFPYTEDGGTVSMFNAQGGQWGIIDTNGNLAVEPSKEYGNPISEYYGGSRRFSEVRTDKTVDFMDVEKDIVLKTIRID